MGKFIKQPLKFWKNKFERVKVLGFKNTILCFYYKIFYSFLSLKFGFDKWHSRASYYCRPYKQVVVSLVNSLNPKSVVEVGCGLGEIISRIKAQQKVGLDVDSRVLKAAKFFNPQLTFIKGSFEKIPPNTEVCIAVNFLHGVKEETFKHYMELLVQKKCHYFVMDRYYEEYIKMHSSQGLYLHYPERLPLNNTFFEIKKIIPVKGCYRYIVLYKIQWKSDES